MHIVTDVRCLSCELKIVLYCFFLNENGYAENMCCCCNATKLNKRIITVAYSSKT